MKQNNSTELSGESFLKIYSEHGPPDPPSDPKSDFSWISRIFYRESTFFSVAAACYVFQKETKRSKKHHYEVIFQNTAGCEGPLYVSEISHREFGENSDLGSVGPVLLHI